MTARKAKSNITKAVATTDDPFEPIDLDPPSPALARWQALADIDHVVEHDGDVSRIMPFSRPAWSTPEGDVVGSTISRCYYTSEYVDVALRYRPGVVDGDCLDPAVVRVRVKQDGNALPLVGMAIRQVIDGERITSQGVGMHPSEALELADALRAAVDLIGGPQ